MPGINMFNSKSLSSPSKNFSVLGREFHRTTKGDLLYMGKKKKPRPNASVELESSSSVQSLSPQGGNPYQMDNPLVSNAKTGKITGGDRVDRAAAKKLAGKSSPAPGVGLGVGLGVGSALLDEFDDDPAYDNMDVGKEALKYASMGATLGPVGAGVGAVVGGVVGLFKKKKYNKEQKALAEKKNREDTQATDSLARQAKVDKHFAKMEQQPQGMYGAQDIDNFIEQNTYA